MLANVWANRLLGFDLYMLRSKADMQMHAYDDNVQQAIHVPFVYPLNADLAWQSYTCAKQQLCRVVQ